MGALKLDRLPPGGRAEKPTQIPPQGWAQVLKRAWKEGKDDNISLLAAGVAYFTFLAIPPTLVAAVTLYGLVSSPAQVQKNLQQASSGIPSSARTVVTDQISRITGQHSGALSVALVVSLLLALWSASAAVQNLMKAINVAYDEEETRGFVKLRGTAMMLTAAGIVFFLVVIALIAALPPVLSNLSISPAFTVVVQVVRWLLLLGLVTAALAVLYRTAPDRDAPRLRWVSLGAVAATTVWIVVSVLLSLYASKSGSYGKNFGALAGIAVLLMWLYLTNYAVLLGAEINAESEQQTEADTTRGEPRPIGARDAVKADSVPVPTGGE
jgi:membrane protein